MFFLGVLLLLPLFFFFFLFGHQGIIAAEALTTHEDAIAIACDSGIEQCC